VPLPSVSGSRVVRAVNADRIGLYGSPTGRFVVLSLIGRRPDLNWAAAVDICGPTNLVTLANAAPAIMRSVVAQQIGDPDADQDSLTARSPLTYADRVRTPLLVIGGAEDTRVPRSESDQLVEQLHAHGIEVDYDLIPGEGHGFTQRANELRARSTAADFLISHLARPWSGT
jgi:dipeptidyl aminopeptidase/acylaminoacyl peptidase